jgi:hypothetical protein
VGYAFVEYNFQHQFARAGSLRKRHASAALFLRNFFENATPVVFAARFAADGRSRVKLI